MRFCFDDIPRCAGGVVLAGLFLLPIAGTIRLSAQEPAAASSAGSPLFAPAAEDDAGTLTPAQRRNLIPDRPRSFDELFRSRDDSRFSLPSMPPPPKPAPRKNRTFLDDQSSWGLVTPDDVIKDYIDKEILKLPEFGPDGRERNKTAVELYYERQLRGKTARDQEREKENAFSADLMEIGGPEAPGLFHFGMPAPSVPDTLRPPAIHSLVPDRGPSPDALSDLMGLKQNPFSKDAIREREANQRQMEAFRRALEFQPSSPVFSPSPSLVQSEKAPERSRGWDNSGPALVNPTMLQNPYDPQGISYNPAIPRPAPVSPMAPVSPLSPGEQVMTAPPSGPETPAVTARPDFSIPQRRF